MNKNYITKKSMEALTRNEVGDNDSLIYKFSDPDGVRTGKSGWSFGRVQFDTRNNWLAILCLRSCGFTVHEAVGIIEQSATDMEAMDAKLRNNKSVVNQYDRSHVHEAVEHCFKYAGAGYGISLASEAVMVHIIDYHNQLYLSPGGKLHRWLQDQKRPITAEDILAFKLEQTKWGKDRPDDVKRRWRNIRHIMGA